MTESYLNEARRSIFMAFRDCPDGPSRMRVSSTFRRKCVGVANLRALIGGGTTPIRGNMCGVLTELPATAARRILVSITSAGLVTGGHGNRTSN